MEKAANIETKEQKENTAQQQPSRSNSSACNCKRGACPNPKCESLCRRCGCACDGLSPSVKLSRKPGSRPKNARQALKRVSSESLIKSSREASKKARASIAASVENEKMKDTDFFHDTDQILRTRSDLRKAFGWKESTMNNMPSIKDVSEEDRLWEKNLRGWSCMRNRLIDMVHHGANILYPQNPEALIQSTMAKLSGENKGSKAPERNEIVKAYDRLETTLVSAYNAAPKGSIERRVARAILVKGLSKKRRNELHSQGKLVISGSAATLAYKDSQRILNGCELTKSAHS